MASDLPMVPFKDGLGIPLVSAMHDPTILVDDDLNQTPYLIHGDKEWQDATQWMDRNYIFKYLDTYYFSWGRDYATYKNI